MLESKKIEAVIFDVDGTLYYNYKMYITSTLFFILHPFLSTAFNRMRRKIRKIDYVAGQTSTAVGESSATGGQSLGQAGESSAAGAQFSVARSTGDSQAGASPAESKCSFKELQIKLLAKEIKRTEQETAHLLEKYVYGQYVSMFQWIKPIKIIKNMLSDLKNRNIKLGIISDFPVGKKLSFLGLDKYWDIVCSADEIGALKPRPESFQLVASKLGIKPEKIIYVGNNYHYDIIGANNAGMKSAHFSPFKKKNSKADYTFFNYKKFRDFVLKLNQMEK